MNSVYFNLRDIRRNTADSTFSKGFLREVNDDVYYDVEEIIEGILVLTKREMYDR